MNTASPAESSKLTPDEAAAVTKFVDAVNSGEIVPLARLFAADAQVNDQLRNFWGLDAIAAWLQREIVGEHVKLNVQGVRKHYDAVIVGAEMSGDFDATGMDKPLAVDLYFTMRSEQIVRLLVLLSRAEATEPEVRRPQ